MAPDPTQKPTPQPTRQPTRQPTPNPVTQQPTRQPTTQPTKKPSPNPVTPLPATSITTEQQQAPVEPAVTPNPINKPVVISVKPTDSPLGAYHVFHKEAKDEVAKLPTPTIQANPPAILQNPTPPTRSPVSPILAYIIVPEEDAQGQQSPPNDNDGSGSTAKSPPLPTPTSQQQQQVQAETETIQSTSDWCNLCGSSKLNSSLRVFHQGMEIPCEQFASVFSSRSIAEGSALCLNYRGQYFDVCCAAVVGAAGTSNGSGSSTELGPPAIPPTTTPGQISSPYTGGSDSGPYVAEPGNPGSRGSTSGGSPPSTTSKVLEGATLPTLRPSTSQHDRWAHVALLDSSSTPVVSIWSCCLTVFVGLIFI